MKLETIKVGQIVNAHGIRGEVRIQPRDGDAAFLTKFKPSCWTGGPSPPPPATSTRVWCWQSSPVWTT